MHLADAHLRRIRRRQRAHDAVLVAADVRHHAEGPLLALAGLAHLPIAPYRRSW